MANQRKEKRQSLKEETPEQRIDRIVREQKRKCAKILGEIKESVEELRCEHHPEAHFKEAAQIPGSEVHFGRPLRLYVCKGCLNEIARLSGKEKPTLRDIERGLITHKPSTAYECPGCGLVRGMYIKERYNSPPESWAMLDGRRGEHYFCNICGVKLGEYY